MILEFVLWLLATIVVGTVTAMVGKKYGVEYLIGMFAASIVIANIVVNKIIQIGPFTATAGLVVYSVTFLLTDTISEFWGKKQATKAIWVGFLALVMLVFVAQMSIMLPGASFWQGQEAFENVLGNTWRICIASFVAYLISQKHDIWAYHFWRKKTKGRHLWFRNNASTWVSQVIDTSIFAVIAFWGIAPVWDMIWGVVILKIGVAVIDTPFLYFIKWYYEKTGKRWRGGKAKMGDVPVM